jgi:hypothetical protein
VPAGMGVSVHRKLLALLVVLIAASAIVPAVGAGADHGHRQRVVLGNSFGPNQDGYGEPHPRRIYGGGDPTGLVIHIHWKHWGSKRATGWGRGFFVWPGLAVAEGVPARARVVAFHLGTCEGHASYNALEWFFPRYHQHFHRGIAGSICFHNGHVRDNYHPRHCGGLNVTRLTRATSITTLHMSCRAARRLIRTSQSSRYAVGGGRFRHHGFYCGSMGWGEIGPPSIFECALDQHSVVFEIYVHA